MDPFPVEVPQEPDEWEARLAQVRAELAAQIAVSQATIEQSQEQVAASREAVAASRALLARLTQAPVHWARLSVALPPKLP
jgi:multidrug resistance efflux pump